MYNKYITRETHDIILKILISREHVEIKFIISALENTIITCLAVYKFIALP